MQDYSSPTPSRDTMKGADLPSKVNVQFPETVKPYGGAQKLPTPLGFNDGIKNGKI